MLTLVGRLLHIVGRLPPLLNPNSCCTTDTRRNGLTECAPILSLANRLDRAWPNIKLCLMRCGGHREGC